MKYVEESNKYAGQRNNHNFCLKIDESNTYKMLIPEQQLFTKQCNESLVDILLYYTSEAPKEI